MFISLYVSMWIQGCQIFVLVCFYLNTWLLSFYPCMFHSGYRVVNVYIFLCFILVTGLSMFISLYVSIWKQGCQVYILVCFILVTGLSMFITFNVSFWLQCCQCLYLCMFLSVYRVVNVYIFVCFILVTWLSSIYPCVFHSGYMVVKFISLYVSFWLQGVKYIFLYVQSENKVNKLISLYDSL